MPRQHQDKIIDSGDMSEATITSEIYEIKRGYGYSVQFAWSGTSPVGTIKLQASNDLVPRESEISNWTDITGSTVDVTGNTGTGMLNVTSSMYSWVRAVYTKTSGTGTLNAVLQEKGEG